jgi:hypothetical protein
MGKIPSATLSTIVLLVGSVAYAQSNWSNGQRSWDDTGGVQDAWHSNGQKAWNNTGGVGDGWHSNGQKAWNDTGRVGDGWHSNGQKAWNDTGDVGDCWDAQGNKVGSDSCSWSWGPGVVFTVMMTGPKARLCTLTLAGQSIRLRSNLCK